MNIMVARHQEQTSLKLGVMEVHSCNAHTRMRQEKSKLQAGRGWTRRPSQLYHISNGCFTINTIWWLQSLHCQAGWEH